MHGTSGIQELKLKRATDILDAIEIRLNKGWLEHTNEMTRLNEDRFEMEE